MATGKAARDNIRHNARSLRPLRSVAVAVLIAIYFCVFGTAFFAIVRAQDTGRASRLTPIQAEIERQRQRLASTEVEERRDALMRLGNLHRPEASRVAANGLSDQIPVVRATAAHAIIHLSSEEAATLLIPHLQDRVEFVRQEVAYALGQTRSRSAVPPLVNAMLGDKKNSVRNASVVALGLIGDESAVVSLSQVLAENSNIDARSTTGRRKKQKKRKARGDEFLLRAAAHSLGQIRSRAGVPALISALSSEANSSDVRREAAMALGIIADKSAMPALQAAVAADDPYLAQIAYDSLRRIANTKQ